MGHVAADGPFQLVFREERQDLPGPAAPASADLTGAVKTDCGKTYRAPTGSSQTAGSGRPPEASSAARSSEESARLKK